MAFPPGQPGQLPPNFPKGPPQQNPLNIPPMPANRLVNPNTFITQSPSQQISQAQLNQALGGQNAIPVANQQFMHGGMQINPQLILQQQQQRTGMPMQGSPNQPPMQVSFSISKEWPSALWTLGLIQYFFKLYKYLLLSYL